jgi:uncharacterized protein
MNKSSIVKASIIGICIILTAMVLGKAFKDRNVSNDAISVIGLGTKDFTSDEILFSGSFSSKAQDSKSAYASINTQHEIVKSFFKAKGFADSEVKFTGVNFEKSYRTISTEANGNVIKNEQIFDGYLATQIISIAANKNPVLMKKIEEVSNQTSELINSGVEFNPNAIQYTCSSLPSLKKSLIENATKDANERAEKIAKTANGDLGKLKTASMGVFQIYGKGAEEGQDSYGGTNDIHCKEKTARITVRLEYMLD